MATAYRNPTVDLTFLCDRTLMQPTKKALSDYDYEDIIHRIEQRTLGLIDVLETGDDLCLPSNLARSRCEDDAMINQWAQDLNFPSVPLDGCR